MKILSLETATYFGGIAFINTEKAVSDTAGPFSARAASKEILVAVDDLLKKHNCTVADLDLVAVSTGPGLFTGVRVGLSIAKTLVWAQGAEGKTALIGVPTLEAVAMLAMADDGATEGDVVTAIIDARRGEVYAAAFEVTEGAPKAIGDDLVIRPDHLHERLFGKRIIDSKRLWLIGDAFEKYPTEIEEQFGGARVCNYQEGNLAMAVAELGRRKLASVGGMRPQELQPHYVRRPDARPSVQL